MVYVLSGTATLRSSTHIVIGFTRLSQNSPSTLDFSHRADVLMPRLETVVYDRKDHCNAEDWRCPIEPRCL